MTGGPETGGSGQGGSLGAMRRGCATAWAGDMLQKVSHVINPNWWQLLPKGRTPWGPCVLHYIYIYLCNKETLLCHLSLLFSIHH
jgi:hypothetical protein